MSNLFPDWIPNVHPLIIHFPIALIIVSLGLLVLTMVIKQTNWREYSILVLLIGIFSLILTYLTGRAAVDSVLLPAQANSVLNYHADYAQWTLIYFLLLGCMILIALKLDKVNTRYSPALLVLLTALGVGLLIKTADFGGQLVYRYGVGVVKTDSVSLEIDQENTIIDSTLTLHEDGSWFWNTSSDQAISLPDNFIWLIGSDRDIKTDMESNSEYGPHLVLKITDTPVFFIAGENLGAIQIDLSADLTEFDGQFIVTHHVSDVNTYDYFSINEDLVQMGRVNQSKRNNFSSAQTDSKGFMSIRLVGINGHYRSYIKDKLVLHSHAKDLQPGAVGLYIQGTGVIRIKNMNVQTLSEDKSG